MLDGEKILPEIGIQLNFGRNITVRACEKPMRIGQRNRRDYNFNRDKSLRCAFRLSPSLLR